MEYEPGYYDVAINIVASELQAASPIVATTVIWIEAEDVIKRLVEEDLIVPLEKCEYANAPKTVVCENLAPLTKSWCFDHGNY